MEAWGIMGSLGSLRPLGGIRLQSHAGTIRQVVPEPGEPLESRELSLILVKYLADRRLGFNLVFSSLIVVLSRGTGPPHLERRIVAGQTGF